jgi:hypothetical protein
MRLMETMQTANAPSFETVWALVKEVAENQKETDRQLKETERVLKELARKTTERQEETDRQLKANAMDFNVRIGALTNLFGEIAEYTIAPKLCEKFREFGLNFPRANPNVSVNDRDNSIFLEIDVMLENGDKAMLVEIKNKLTTERINKHIERIEKMRKYADLRGDKRVFLGAVAGVVVNDEVKKYALEQGFYLIEPSGDNFRITPPNGNPREW